MAGVPMRAARKTGRRPKVLAIASGGGHWTQLMRLRPAFEGADILYVSTVPGHADFVPGERYATVPAASRWEKVQAARCAVAVFRLVARERPDVIVSVGALPGYFAVLFGKVVFRRRTLWVDSIANAEELSLSGRLAGRHADVWLTQWEHLAHVENGPRFAGSVLA